MEEEEYIGSTDEEQKELLQECKGKYKKKKTNINI
jgi:hypothetical protein